MDVADCLTGKPHEQFVEGSFAEEELVSRVRRLSVKKIRCSSRFFFCTDSLGVRVGYWAPHTTLPLGVESTHTDIHWVGAKEFEVVGVFQSETNIGGIVGR